MSASPSSPAMPGGKIHGKNAFFFIIVTVFIDMMAFAVIMPSMPYLVAELINGKDALVIEPASLREDVVARLTAAARRMLERQYATIEITDSVAMMGGHQVGALRGYHGQLQRAVEGMIGNGRSAMSRTVVCGSTPRRL